MAAIGSKQDELNTEHEVSAPNKMLDTEKQCSQPAVENAENVSERKKVYRSIFGLDASSESSVTDESSYDTEPEKNKSPFGKKKSPVKTDVKNLLFRLDTKENKEINQDLEFTNSMQNGQEESTDDINLTGEKLNMVTDQDMQIDPIIGDTKTEDACLNDAGEAVETTQKSGFSFLSPEEKEAVSHLALSHIAEELDKRNKVENEGNTGTQLYTGPYGRIHSPFKKFSSFQGFPGGVKRSPRKLSGPAAKRTKLFHEDIAEPSSTEVSPLSREIPNKTKEANEASGDDSSDDDKWEIVEEEPSGEIDQVLENKSSKFSLSVINVKSIIHKIITNENVVEMVRKAVQEEIDEHEQKFEPKMTRSKLKEFEAQGQVPLNWGLSPRKKRESPNFLEMELPEDEEDDEDFNPDKVVLESDEDSESVLSSCLSDIGSPIPSTPKSVLSTSALTPSRAVSTPTPSDNDTSITVDENSSQSFLSPMGPPLQTNVPKSQHKASGLGQKYHDAMERDKQRTEEEAELIASRTRSKYPLKDCSILDLEANFVAPDITQDMYEICDDVDWAEFLIKLTAVSDKTITNTLNTTNEEEDTEDDPEYNFQEEIDTLEYDREDFRDDRAVKVSKKEMNELLDDVLNNDGDYDNMDEQYKITIKTQSEKIVFNSNKKKQTQYQQSLISAIGEHERKQIDDQLRKHVQQLAQTYVMVQNGIEEHKPMGDTAKFYLTELSNFADKSETIYGTSAYRVCNLEPALQLLEDRSWQDNDESPQNIKERVESLTFKHDCQCLPPFKYNQMMIMWTSPVFIYPDLVPHGGFFKQADIKRDRARVKFLEPEDNLLAMGVAQFSHLKKDAKDYIQRFLLPCKSRKQIEIRIKNLNAKASKDNAVKFYRTYKRLPRFPQHAPEFDISMMKSLKDGIHDWNELPWWCRIFCTEDNTLLNESVREHWERQKEIKRRRKERQSASFSLSESDIAAMLTPPHPSASAPVTPSTQTDSSVSGSSGSESMMILPTYKRKRPRRQSRKKLSMNKQKKSDMGIVGSFVPLPLPGSSIPQTQQSPLTICVLDNMQVTTPVASPCYGTLPGNPAASCATPTIYVINKNAPLQNLNQTMTFTTQGDFPQTVTPFTQTSAQVPLSMPSFNPDNSKYDSDIDGKALTFEDICRPIMEAELAAAGVVSSGVTDKELCTLYTENGSIVNVDAIKNDVIVNVVQNVTSNNTVVSNVSLPSTSAVINQHVDLESLNKTISEVQSSEISSTVQKDQSEVQNNLQEVIFQDTATSPFPVADLAQEVTLQEESGLVTAPPNEEQTSDTTDMAEPAPIDCRCTPTQELNSQTSGYYELTPKQTRSSSDVSSSEKTPKSSLEMVASLAPYFISPIHNTGSLQQISERTPTKRKLPTLAPKSVSPGQRTTPISFSDLRSPTRRQVKSSPRKKHLQQQVKTILPKGFVISSFDTSPAKKAASNLVDKAKHLANHSKGFCKILPRPPNQANTSQDGLLSKSTRRRIVKNFKMTSNQNNTKESGIDTQSEDMSDNISDVNENINNPVVDDDDRCGDTESDYTQSEDGNETQGTDGEDGDTQGTDDGEGTQGTDGDSQDSQEEDNHTADLRTASTTIGFVPTREDMYSRSRLGKKDRDRDLTLALLEPDIVEADPQRDLRDTLFAQAYIHRVKKVLRDDVDKLEQFLRIMYHFSQDGGTPIKLYNDLQELFAGQPELIYDFAGFLQAEQAIECGCYKAYQEFNHARTFLRKLEIYFTKNPNQLQKVMRTFSRWYKKPGRKESDLREQIEPMLKGQKMLLEEFSRFFPNERPNESLMDDFEEINLDDSGENEDKDTSFEEINLLDLEEVYGTKRCTCECHDAGDDTYRKRKKHCYKCCLTVIDGELVYKVNKSTIKKINVTYGPPVKLSSLQSSKDQSDSGKQETVSADSRNQEPANTGMIRHETGDREPSNLDWFLDSETAEKENIEHFSEGIKNEKDVQHRKANKGKSSPSKESFLQRINKLSRNKPQEKQTRLSSVIKGRSVSPPFKGGQQVSGEHHVSEEHQSEVEQMETEEIKQFDTELMQKVVPAEDKGELSEIIPMKIKKSKSVAEMEKENALRKDSEGNEQNNADTEMSVNNMKTKPDPVAEDSKRGDSSEPCNSAPKQDDILATAFSSALNAEVSMDSLCFPFNMSENNKTDKVNVDSSKPASGEIERKETAERLQELRMKSSTAAVPAENAIKPTVVTSVIKESAALSAPAGQSSLHISTDSSFKKVPSSDNIAPNVNDVETNKDTGVRTFDENKSKALGDDKKKEDVEASLSNQVSKIDHVLERSRSPPFSPFSPFSPFAQEIQSITSVQSPLSAVSPNIRSLSSSGKVRRITPVAIKGTEGRVDTQSSFQTAMENSPVLPDVPTVSSPFEFTQSARSKSVDNFTHLSANSVDNSQEFLNTTKCVLSADSGSDSQKLEGTLQKSNSNTTDTSSSQTSTISEPSFTSMVISKPDIFSENANVGFPKVSLAATNSVVGHSGILSEESLFQCLSKPPTFSETIPTVSNLTNILHALDGHSQAGHLHGNNQTIETGQECNKNSEKINVSMETEKIESITISSSDEINNKYEAKDVNEVEKVTVTGECDKQLMDTANSSPNDSFSSSSSGDTGEEHADKLYPKTVQSIENMERLKTGLFKVSSLSDSDTSCVSTPSASVTSILDKQPAPLEQSKEKEISSVDKLDSGKDIGKKDIEENVHEQSNSINTEVTEHVIKSDEHVPIKVLESRNDSVTETEKLEKRKKRKMSRRELRRSLQGKDAQRPESREVESADEDESVDQSHKEEKDSDVAVQYKNESANASENVSSGIKASEKIDIDDNRPGSGQDVQKLDGLNNRLVDIKTEEPEMIDNTGMSDVQSISDTVSEASSRGHKKSKHKRKNKSDKEKDRSRKKKRRKEDKELETTPKADKKKRKKSKRKEQEGKLETAKAAVSENDRISDDEEQVAVQEPNSNATATTDSMPTTTEDHGASAISPVSKHGNQMDEEPEWSKEIDKTILENCKVHGIKEKTFLRIAKEIGNVTAKQVRRRFAHLYQMIFGSPFGEKGND